MPVFVVTEAETVWMNFLTHNFLQSFKLNRLLLLFALFPSALAALFFAFSRIGRLLDLALPFGCRAAGAWRSRRATTLPAFAFCKLRGLRFRYLATISLLFNSRIVGEQNRHVTKMALLAVSSSLWSRPYAPAVLCRAAVHENRFHPEIICIDRNIRLLRCLIGISNRRTHAFLDAVCSTLVGVTQNGQCLVYIFATNQ